MDTILLFLMLVILILTLLLVYNQVQLLKEINSLIKKLWLKKPGKVTLKIYEGENGMLKFVLSLPPKSAADVVSRVLNVKVGDGEAQLFELAADALESQEFSCADNTEVVGSLADVDDAGNTSEARPFSFVIVDTIAPPMPGEVGVLVTGEFDQEPEVEPVPEPEPEADADDLN